MSGSWPCTRAARDFVTDAFAHCKFIGYTAAAAALFNATGLADQMDDGFVELSGKSDADGFLEQCAQLRYWSRPVPTA